MPSRVFVVGAQTSGVGAQHGGRFALRTRAVLLQVGDELRDQLETIADELLLEYTLTAL